MKSGPRELAQYHQQQLEKENRRMKTAAAPEPEVDINRGAERVAQILGNGTNQPLINGAGEKSSHFPLTPEKLKAAQSTVIVAALPNGATVAQDGDKLPAPARKEREDAGKPRLYVEIPGVRFDIGVEEGR